MQQSQENESSPNNQQQVSTDDCKIKIIQHDESISKSNVILDLNENQKVILNEIYTLKMIQIVKIQSHLRMRNQKQKYKVMRKMAKQRHGCLFYDLLKTEENFVQNLELINNSLITIVQQNNYLSEQDQSDYFQNWQQIYRLNQQLLADLQKQFVNYHSNICISETFKKYIHFFKIYYDYYSNYNGDKKQEIRQRNQQFNELITKLENSSDFNNSPIESFLILPSQRLPRYELILKELVRHTPEDHPDYSNLKSCLNDVKKIIGNINQQMLSNQLNQILFELQRKIFDPIKMEIVETTRRLIAVETVFVKIGIKKKYINLYLCNDLIILTNRIKGQEQYLTTFKLSDVNNVFMNKFSKLIHFSKNQQSLRFWCFDKEQFNNLTELLINIFQNQPEAKTHNSLINVKVLASSKQISMMKKYTEYYLNITYGQKQFLCATRHKILCLIEEFIDKKFTGISQTLLKGQKWIRDNLNKLEIKQRVILIEQFLTKVLNSQELKNCKETSFLELLELPSSFYNEIVGQETLTEAVGMIYSMYANNLQLRGAYTYDIQYYNQRQFDPQDQLINLKITYMGRVLNWKFEIKKNLENLRSEIAKIIELKLSSFNDFRFYLAHQKKEIFLRNISLGEVQIMKNKLKNQMQKFLNNDKKSLKLILRKSFFFEIPGEILMCCYDYVRLSLMCHQIFRDYKNGQYLQEIQNFQIISYSFIIKYWDFYLMNLDGKALTDFDIFFNIDKFIPEEIYKQKKIHLWFAFIRSEIPRLQNYLRAQMESLGFAKIDLKTKIHHLTMLNFLINEKQNRLFGSSIYDIKISKESQKLFKITFDKSVEASNKIALKFDRLYILAKCEILIDFTLKDIIDLDFEKNVFHFSISQKPGRYNIKIDEIDQFQYQIEKYIELQSKVPII